uniref:Uncharacterized protein n=1 Tax=Lepeophtheirus salmonis TaxID=72036 RepID=A0A0K2UBM6_LEPSM
MGFKISNFTPKQQMHFPIVVNDIPLLREGL